jgi:Uma2 family endonuclease
MPSTRPPLRIRTKEFDRMANTGVFDPDRPRIELLGGQLYEMAPIGTPHLMVVTRLQRLFEKGLAEDLRVLVQQPLIVDRFNEPQPDVVVLREPLGKRKPVAQDCLVVIEVSDTSYHEDRYVKLPAYLRGGVRLVWIVNIREGQLEVYDRVPAPDERGGKHYSPGKERPSVADISVDVGALLADLSLDDLG